MDANHSERPLNILILDGENYHLIAVLHCLSRVKKLRLFVISEKRTPSMRFSRFVSKFMYCPIKSDPKRWVDLVNDCIKRHEIDVVMHLTEDIQELLIRHVNDLSLEGKILIIESLKQLDIARDKRQLSVHMSTNEIPSPRFWIPDNTDISISIDQDMTFPVLLKPAVISGGGLGIVKIDNSENLNVFFSQSDSMDNYVIQEYIEGSDLGCNVLCKEGEILAYTIQVGNMFSNKPYAPQIGLEMVHNEEVFEIITKLMRSLHWNGVANVDMRYDHRTKQYYVLEINPRYWLTLLASCMSGVNFPWLYCQTVLGMEFPIPDYKNMEFWNITGVTTQIRKKPITLFRWKFLWNNTPIPYLINDPGMTGYHYLWSFKNIVFSIMNKIFPRRRAA